MDNDWRATSSRFGIDALIAALNNHPANRYGFTLQVRSTFAVEGCAGAWSITETQSNAYFPGLGRDRVTATPIGTLGDVADVLVYELASADRDIEGMHRRATTFRDEYAARWDEVMPRDDSLGAQVVRHGLSHYTRVVEALEAYRA